MNINNVLTNLDETLIMSNPFKGFPDATEIKDPVVTKNDVAVAMVATQISKAKVNASNFANIFSCIGPITDKLDELEINSSYNIDITSAYNREDEVPYEGLLPEGITSGFAAYQASATNECYEVIHSITNNLSDMILENGVMTDEGRVLTINTDKGVIHLRARLIQASSPDEEDTYVIEYDVPSPESEHNWHALTSYSESRAMINGTIKYYDERLRDPGFTLDYPGISLPGYSVIASNNALCYDLVTDALFAVKTDAEASFDSVINKYRGNAAVAELATHLEESYIVGGSVGVFQGIQDFFNNTTRISTNTTNPNDTFLEYIDPTIYAPIDFVSGVANAVINTLSAVIPMVLAVISPILGAIGVAIAGIVSIIRTALADNVRLKAKFSDGDLAVYPVHISALQKFYSRTEQTVGKPAEFILVKDGALLTSARGFKVIASGSSGIARTEIFVDLIDRLKILRSYPYGESAPIRKVNHDQTYYEIGFYDSNRLLHDNPILEERFPVTSFDSELSDFDDAHLRLVISLNLMITLSNFYSLNFCMYTRNLDEIFSLNDFEYTDASQNSPERKIIHGIGNILQALYAYATTPNLTAQNQIDLANQYVKWTDLYDICYSLSLKSGLYKESDPDLDHPYLISGLINDYYFDKLFVWSDNGALNGWNDPCMTVLTGNLTPSLVPANADKTTIIVQSIAISAAILATASVATVVGIKVKRAITKKKAMNAAMVERTYQDFYTNPNDETYNAYRKAVRDNNLTASFLGGTKYSKVNRWDDANGGDSKDSGAFENLKTKFFKLNENVESNDTPSLAGIITLIRGE